ncbi:Ubiquitin-like domain-containing protein [Aphelenchoides besseyi]|nr:Ubiquitin-like domain-containing protein [Aphelenchoides besseyi]
MEPLNPRTMPSTKPLVHREEPFSFDEKTIFKQLQSYIDSTFQIDSAHQHIFHNDKRMGLRISVDDTLVAIGFGNADIVIKHSDLDLWKSYCECAKEFRNAYGENKKTVANDALVYSTKLRKTSFFIVYPKFGIEVLGYHRPIGNFLDKSIDSIKDAATNLFNWVTFKGQSPNIAFEPVDDNGTRPAVRCTVTVNAIIHEYRIKCNHDAGGLPIRV